MDPTRIDSLARLVGSGQSRRGVLKTLAGGAAAVITAAAGLNRAGAAAKTRPLGAVCAKNADCESAYCSPKDRTGRQYCGCNPLDLQTDIVNCGTCGNVCPGDFCNLPACGAGVCFTIPAPIGSCYI